MQRLVNFLIEQNMNFPQEAAFFDQQFIGGGTVKDYLNLQSNDLVRETLLRVKYIHFTYLAPYMKGWDVPGTFNLMVYHMLTDKYSADGKAPDGYVYEGPELREDDCDNASVLASQLITAMPAYLQRQEPKEQYYCRDLLDCWVAQLAFLRSYIGGCSTLKLFPELNPPFNVSNSIDEDNEGDRGIHDSHFDQVKIKGWAKLFIGKRRVKKKISREARRIQDVDFNANTSSEDVKPIDFQYHAVQEFLNCAGYRFAGILTPSDPSPLADGSLNIESVQNDFDTSYVGLYQDKYELYTHPDPNSIHQYNTLRTHWIAYNGKNRGYQPNPYWKVLYDVERVDGQGNASRPGYAVELFEYIKDPVYAFKYFEYFHEVQSDTAKSDYRKLEYQTCYSNPPDCELCGLGWLQCDITREDWTAGQRYTFYEFFRNFLPGEPEPDETLKAEDFITPGYTQEDAQGNTRFILWNEEDTDAGGDPLEYDAGAYQTDFKDQNFEREEKRLKTKVELDLDTLNKKVCDWCDSQREAIAARILETLIENCYTLVDCDIGGSSQFLVSDVDTLVGILVKECKKRGMMNTFRVDDTGCKWTYNLQNYAVPSVTYGVNDPSGTPATLYMHYRDGLTQDTFSNYSEDARYALLTRNEAGEKVPVVDMSGQEPYSYCQWRRRQEVTEMTLNLFFPSMCNCQPAITLDNDGELLQSANRQRFYLNGNFSADGSSLLLGDPQTGPVQYNLSTGAIRSFQNPDGALSVAQLKGHVYFTGKNNKGIRRINAATWANPGNYAFPRYYSLTTDGSFLYGAGYDEEGKHWLRQWEPGSNGSLTEEESVSLKGHVEGITHYDGHIYYCQAGYGRGDRKIYAWNTDGSSVEEIVYEEDGETGAIKVPGNESVYQVLVHEITRDIVPSDGGASQQVTERLLWASTETHLYAWKMDRSKEFTVLCETPGIIFTGDKAATGEIELGTTGNYLLGELLSGLAMKNGKLYVMHGRHLSAFDFEQYQVPEAQDAVSCTESYDNKTNASLPNEVGEVPGTQKTTTTAIEFEVNISETGEVTRRKRVDANGNWIEY